MAAHAVDRWLVVVARCAGKLMAFNDRCPHQATRLSTGRIRKGAIMCPLHGARGENQTRETIADAAERVFSLNALGH